MDDFARKRSSFAIEREEEQTSRIRRFADAIHRLTGAGEGAPLRDATLANLQREIVGPKSALTHFGARLSPVFIGDAHLYGAYDEPTVHYVAPMPEDVDAMLDGLAVFLDKTHGQSPVMRAAVASFGFVYIHPLADGNGRTHRFLFNDLLRRDGAVDAPYIIPLSALIQADTGAKQAYYKLLEEISAPLMREIREEVSFSRESERCLDGVSANFHLSESSCQTARPAWRYPKLEAHIVWLARALERTIDQHMREEARYLRRRSQAREALKDIIDMPDPYADRIIRSFDDSHGGPLSKSLAKDLTFLTPELWEQMVEKLTQIYAAFPVSDLSQASFYK